MNRRGCISMTFALAAVVLLCGPLGTPVYADLVGLYRFEDATNPGKDSSTMGNDLAAFGGWAIDPNGKYGQGLALNGADAVLAISDGMGGIDDDSLPNGFPINHASYTLAAWETATVPVNDMWNQQLGIIGWGAYGSPSHVNALRLASDVAQFGSGIRHYWWANDLDFKDTNTVNLADGTFHHVAVTYDDSAGMRSIYVDGVLMVSDTPARHHARVGDFRIGRTCNICGGGEFFQGTLDDVAVFNEALSADAIGKIMSGDFSDFGVPPQ
jgi:hypothetical protein